jgi:hypothetical protein
MSGQMATGAAATTNMNCSGKIIVPAKCETPFLQRRRSKRERQKDNDKDNDNDNNKDKDNKKHK